MASLSIDVASLVEQIRTSVESIRTQVQTSNQRKLEARLLVYRAFALHPCLDALKPDGRQLSDLDWYCPRTSSVARFRDWWSDLGVHFHETSTMGPVGQRARIMMLLFWIIGHKIKRDKIRQMLSTAVHDGFEKQSTATVVAASATPTDPADVRQSVDLATTIEKLHEVTDVFDSIATMIKTQLPLPRYNNPFYGDDYNERDDDLSFPKEFLWVYRDGLDESKMYTFDVKKNPSVLLRPSKLVLVPDTKLSMLALVWCTDIFGLGRKAANEGDIDPDAYWNAD